MDDMDSFDDFDITQEDITQIENIEFDLLNRSLHLSSDEEDNIQPTHSKRRRVIQSESEDSDSETNRAIQDLSRSLPPSTWTDPKGNQRRVIAFTEFPGMTLNLRMTMLKKCPADFFALMVTDEVLNKIVLCTDAYAFNRITMSNEASKAARIRGWVPTNLTEIKKFFGLILYMGIVRLPKIADYWTTDKIIGQQFPRTIMSRNRFELLLAMLHFSQEDEENTTDRLHRVRDLVEVMNANFKKAYTPGEDLCIDESMIPFRGRIIFRQYNKQKRHKYGIKLFKLCTLPGYTYKLSIYAGKQNDEVNTTPMKVVMALCDDLLNKGHTLYTDNWYTSVGLARELLKNETHLVGTLRKNRKHFPKEIVSTKLKRGQYIAKESNDGITVLRWRDKRDVLVLSTKHSVRFQSIIKHGKQTSKPKIVLDYNKAKGAVDLSDQMTAYQTPLRKSIKWYKKLGIDILLNTAMVNALILYQSVARKKISVLEFRKEIMKSFVDFDTNDTPSNQRTKRVKHQLKKKEGPTSKSRRACQQCYKNMVATHGRLIAKNKTKKVNTFCVNCPDKPYLCVECFTKIH
ncbi:piggyBac transposable element-derived protein 4-like [Spodoptera litura]|uniref:PiggyBac transposable element-derived protein 4-like n=1 Tax=Spodoptera litura TaxID=69820 RepID=A0A9J7EWV9_SPOLT|nr:piggyBac transposable element-derived protein 4-like [Spodoptera litura]